MRRSRDLILRGGRNITTNATGENVIGGNIDINTNVLAAVENGDINANSTDFRGGNVRINAQDLCFHEMTGYTLVFAPRYP